MIPTKLKTEKGGEQNAHGVYKADEEILIEDKKQRYELRLARLSTGEYIASSAWSMSIEGFANPLTKYTPRFYTKDYALWRCMIHDSKKHVQVAKFLEDKEMLPRSVQIAFERVKKDALPKTVRLVLNANNTEQNKRNAYKEVLAGFKFGEVLFVVSKSFDDDNVYTCTEYQTGLGVVSREGKMPKSVEAAIKSSQAYIQEFTKGDYRTIVMCVEEGKNLLRLQEANMLNQLRVLNIVN